MAEFDEAMPSKETVRAQGLVRAVGLPTTAWFEFILDASRLEKHLNDPDADLSAPELISLFLYQADIALATVREIEGKEVSVNGSSGSGSDATLDEKPRSAENRKVQTLRLLAVKTACHLKWNLEFLESNLPLAILRSLLLELLKLTTNNSEDVTSKVLTPDELRQMEPEALFAIVLYHRWCLTSLIRESFPARPSKIPNVQVPGLLDPSISSANLKDAILKSLRESMDISISQLENFLLLGQATRMAVMSCFGIVKSDSSSEKMSHDWNNGIMIDETEMICQVTYDLGCQFFLLRNYEKANNSFRKCKEYVAKVPNPIFSNVDIQRLDGYLSACSGVLCLQSRQPVPSLYERVQSSVRNNFQGLTGLMIEDLTKQELSLMYRTSLEESTQAAHRQDSLYEEVLVCNSIRRSLDGRVAMFDLVTTLNRTLGLVDFFLKVCVDIHKMLSDSQKDNLKFFLRYLCQMISSETRFVDLLLSCELQNLFTPLEKESLMALVQQTPSSIGLSPTIALPPPVEENMKVAEVERELLVTYDPNLIKEHVQKLIGRIGKYQTVFLSDKWRIPRDLHQAIETLPIPQPVTPIFVHILVAKARICVQLRHFDRAKELLNFADTTIRDISLKLTKMLRFEILRAELLQLLGSPQPIAYNGNFQDLVKRVKTCITTFQQVDHESLPCPELLSACVAFILNNQEFDYLCSLSNGNSNGFIQFGRMLAALCKEIPLLKTARTSAREFIDAVRLTFTNTMQVKRNNSGATSMVMRESNTALLPVESLVMLMRMVREPTVLSLLVSCLTKLFNLMKDDIAEEIYSDYITLWPTALSSSNTKLNEASVTDAVVSLMDHVLSVNPSQPSWLRTQADLSYARGDYFLSLRYYLLLGIVSTDFFTEPISKNVYDDQVYRRMIRCCSALNCHTQEAVLCQFLDETDYTIAFKALQERICVDAADAYYDCIWDSTILEFLIHLHNKRGEVEKRQFALRLIGQMELNSNNRSEVLSEAAKLRKGRFMRAMAKQYLTTADSP